MAISRRAGGRRWRDGRSSRSAALLILLLCAACGGSGSGSGSGGGSGQAPQNVAPPTNTISGVVTFRGAALAGVMVTAYSTNTNTVAATTTTDANGKYSFSGLEATSDVTADFQLWPTLKGYAFYPAPGAGAPSPSVYQFDKVPKNWFVPAGIALTRAEYNGAFTTANGGSPIVLDVINFMSVANGSATGADFTAYDGTNPLAALAATVIHSYVAGDDAAEQAGIAWPAVRFIDNADGTISDTLTGLVWLRNAGCLAPSTWAAALTAVNQLASGACGLSDGSRAGDWHLPNLVEFESVIDLSSSNPALAPAAGFTNPSSGIYWTATAYYGGQEGTTQAWAVRLSDGRYINDGAANLMASSSNAVWAVRGTGAGLVRLQATGAYVPFAAGDDGSLRIGAALPSPRMIDHGNGTVTDAVTGLVWLKQADCIKQTWTAAVGAVKALAAGQCGLTDGSVAGDWRMPNRREMQSLADRAQNNHADYFDETFTSNTVGVSSQLASFTRFVGFQYYWTSTTDAADPTQAWTVFSCDFGVYDIPKANVGYTLAVR